MELFDYSLWAAPIGLVIAVVVLIWRRWVLPLLLGIVAVPVGGVVGRYAWEWFAERPPGVEFGTEFEGLDWVIGFASVGGLLGVLAGVFLSAKRRARRNRLAARA